MTQTALGIPAAASSQDLDLQARTITAKLNLSDFQDPVKLQKFIQRFTIMYDMTNNTASQDLPNALLVGDTPQFGVSADFKAFKI